LPLASIALKCEHFAMRRAWFEVMVLTVVVGCSSGATTSPGNDGSADAPAVGDGSVQDVGVDAGTLPACAVATRPIEPTGPTAICSTFVITGATITPQPYQPAANGGVADDGGVVIAGPSGGTVLDGDYDLVQVWSNTNTNQDARTLRFFDQGTHVEWAVQSASAGGVSVRRNTTISTSGATLTIVSTDCGPASSTTSYQYAASGDELTMFFGNANPPSWMSVYTYQRTCAR
jgi:hypothetical protein